MHPAVAGQAIPGITPGFIPDEALLPELPDSPSSEYPEVDALERTLAVESFKQKPLAFPEDLLFEPDAGARGVGIPGGACLRDNALRDDTCPWQCSDFSRVAEDVKGLRLGLWLGVGSGGTWRHGWSLVRPWTPGAGRQPWLWIVLLVHRLDGVPAILPDALIDPMVTHDAFCIRAESYVREQRTVLVDAGRSSSRRTSALN